MAIYDIEFASLSETYPIMCLNGSWTTREISGQDCLTMAINANANNNGFLLVPTRISGNDGYTILTFKADSLIDSAYLIDGNSGVALSGDYNYGGIRNNSGITRPDLRGIRLSGASGLNANYSGNQNGSQITFNNNQYTAFAYADLGYGVKIYLPSFITNVLINDSPLVTYTWVSVPSVSGKNGILSLAQIKSEYINDGEAVSGAAATAFSDLPAECNVGEIIDELLPYEESLVDVLVKYKIKGAVTGAFDYVKLVAKKGSIPKSVEDGDKVIDINPSKKSKLVTGLDEGSKYYFVIFEKDSAGQTAQSNEKSIRTGDLPDGTIFEYTGEIQTFVAPKTGIYQLETWGAQGGDATDGTLTARGGYGAYAVGEVFLTQGDILYINVGGQNGYGGGGLLDPVPEDYQYIKNINDMDVYNTNCTSHYSVFDDTHKYGWWRGASGTFYEYTPIKPLNEMTICADSGLTAHHNKNKTGTGNNIYTSFSTSIITIKLNGNDSDGYDVTYENDSRTTLGNAFTGVYSGEQNYKGARLAINDDHSNPGAFTSLGGYTNSGSGWYGNFTSHYNSLSDALSSIYDSFCNVNIYVNNVPWVEV